jgi:peptidoglycan lytic transglycosylase D
MSLDKFSPILLTVCLLFLQGAWAGDGAATPSTAVPELKISYTLAAVGSEDPAAEGSADLWARLREGFRLKDVNPALTRTHEKWFMDHSSYLDNAIQRSRLYLYHIAEEVHKRDMPMEIALLPVIESAFNPMAQSPRKASGIWQFIPSTGRIYGLEQNAWYDGRRDVLAATQAALDYLQDLYDQFGSWELALAAYNCGEGCVARAVARNEARGKSLDYADLNLPTETKHYVPKLIAVRNIVEDPERYGFVLDDLANEPYFMQVNLTFPIAARQAAKLADMNLDEFLALNPAFQRRVIYSDTPGILLLPADKVETFNLNLNRLGSENLSLRVYKARRGESVTGIAHKFGVSLQWIKDHNPLKLFRGRLTMPQSVYVPQAAEKEPRARVAHDKRAPAVPPKDGSGLRVHTVKEGDTLGSLAKLYDVNISDIRLYNEAADPLQPGLKLNIPKPRG